MTVDELREALRGMAGDREVFVRIQGATRPLVNAWIETEKRPDPEQWGRYLRGDVAPDEEVQYQERRSVILSDHMY